MKKNRYDRYIATKPWKLLDKAIQDLINNNDLEEKTDRYYIIGYLIRCLKEHDLLKENH